MKDYTTATKQDVLDWLEQDIITVYIEEEDDYWIKIFKGDKELTQRIKARKRMEGGDLVVDVRYKNKRRSINVSHLVWMDQHRVIIPDNFEIHHVDEDSSNNFPNNLCCVFGKDHHKLHTNESEEEIPF